MIDLSGTTAVPERQVRMIMNGDFVGMPELRPHSWWVEEMYTHQPVKRIGLHRTPVTDISQ